MNAGYDSLPPWIVQAFAPVRDTVILLLDRGEDALARKLVEAMPQPAGLSDAAVAEFAGSKSAMLGGIDALIKQTAAADPFQSAASLEMLEIARVRRLQ